MPRSKTVGLLFEAWNDMDRVLANLTVEDAVQQWGGGSSFAWTLGHVTENMDAWINVRFQGLPPHPLIGSDRFRYGGSGEARDWREIREGVDQVRRSAREYLQNLTEDDLNLVIPYDGSLGYLHETGLPLRYALMIHAAHHYFHIGEIAAKRDQLGHKVGGFPGNLSECI